ncbi:hypothetical protein BX600DRAFT_532692, partial [Xylariales sp. PMI_506]
DGYISESPTSEHSSSSSPSPQAVVAINLGNECEIRSFEFFQSVVAPMLAGHFDEDIWGCTIAQISISEPAVKHAALALSSWVESGLRSDIDRRKLALIQNSKAIKAALELKEPTLVLLICILFICQEWLHGQIRSAIIHLNQGLKILDSIKNPSPMVTEVIAPIFCRLYLFPMFFGHSSSVPVSSTWFQAFTDDLSVLETKEAALSSLAGVWVFVISCIRDSEGVRYGTISKSSLPISWYARYQKANELMWRWSNAYASLLLQKGDTDKCPFRVLWVQYLIARVWLDVALIPGQLSFDKHHDKFESIVENCTVVVEKSGIKKSGAFSFDIGIIPILFFTGAKCRYAKTRLMALDLLHKMAKRGVRENLWHAESHYEIVKLIIEHEHDLSITKLMKKVNLGEEIEMPPSERRVIDYQRLDISTSHEENTAAHHKIGATVILQLKDQAGWGARKNYVVAGRE